MKRVSFSDPVASDLDEGENNKETPKFDLLIFIFIILIIYAIVVFMSSRKESLATLASLD